ncbi:hypothetical protein SAMN05216302_103018 [Nitrosomonas aestuarii]|uniref:Uncharacterized protein n=1 Tax=Nitrosomonas aestuarii TaxID=52441 RepID=A0A1I4ESC2_9PROT|nr:hypothetical protein SAMN05216302_103018 [Nitrosomonas aestuarii]
MYMSLWHKNKLKMIIYYAYLQAPLLLGALCA